MTEDLHIRLDPASRALVDRLAEQWFPERTYRDAAVVRRALELAARAAGLVE